jgi:hypothetical protein
MKYLTIGSRGDEVKALQKALNNYSENLPLDGVYSSRTAEAVMRVQQKLREPAINGNAVAAFQKKIKVVLPYVEKVVAAPTITPLQLKAEAGQKKVKTED